MSQCSLPIKMVLRVICKCYATACIEIGVTIYDRKSVDMRLSKTI